MEKIYKKYTHTGKQGIDDLTSTIPYDGDPNWPIFRPAFDITEEEYKADKQGYADRVTAQNNEYVNKLKEEGIYGKEYQVHFNFMSHPDFDQPANSTESNFTMLIPKGHGKDLKIPKFTIKYDK